MKTAWNWNYIAQKTGSGRGIHEWRSAKLQEFERRTGVKWATWTQNAMIVFAPTWDSTEPTENRELGDRIIGQLRGLSVMKYTRFLPLAETLDTPLPEVIATCKWLTKNGVLVGTVGRTGGCCAVQLRAR